MVEVTPPKADGIYIIKMPKTNYKLGEPFETEGFSAVKCTKNGKEIRYYNDKQAFFIITNQSSTYLTDAWGRGKPLTQAGTIDVRVSIAGTVLRYNITVDGYSSNSAATGGAELRKLTSPPSYELKIQPDGNYTIKTASGKYLGVTDPIKDGIQLKEVSSPYLWTYENTNSPNHAEFRFIPVK